MGIIIDCFAGGGGASVGIEMALGRNVDLLWASHDCTSHSKASGIAKQEDKQ